MQIWGSVGKCQNYRFFYIFLDILDEIKSNLGQEYVKGGFYLSKAKLEQLYNPNFPGRMTVFQFWPYFPLVPP